MSITAPRRSLEQRMAALERANEIRSFRSALKHELKRGGGLSLAVLALPPKQAEGMKVYDYLVSLPGVGPVKALKLLRRLFISPAKTMGGLTARQRMHLYEALNGGTRR